MSDADKPTLRRGILSTRLGAARVIDVEASEQDSSRLRESLKRQRTGRDTGRSRVAEPPPQTPAPNPDEVPRAVGSRRNKAAAPTRAEAPPVRTPSETPARPDRPDSAGEQGRVHLAAPPEPPSPPRTPKRDWVMEEPEVKPPPASHSLATEAPRPPETPPRVEMPPVPLGQVSMIRSVDLHPAPALVTVSMPDSPQARGYRSLMARLAPRLDRIAERTVIAFVAVGQSTSGNAVPANLAVLLSRSGRSTCLVDVGLRRGGAAGLFGVPGETGLANWLTGDTGLLGFQFGEVPGLTLIAGGDAKGGAEERLMHPRFRDWLRSSAGQHGTVILDATAVEDVADAQAVASMAGYAIVVVCKHSDSLNDARSLVDELRAHDVGILGSVFVDETDV